jgi:hypothetical protein
MNRNPYTICFLALGLAGFVGCSSQSADQAGKAAAAPDKIQGQAQIMLAETSAADAALNAGGPSVYLLDGVNRYRLFFNSPFQVDAGKEYVAEGVLAQKAIDEIGDPDQGKNGYPLAASCDRVVRMAWPGQAFDVTDLNSSALRVRVKRYPARPVFLVTKIALVPPKEGADSPDAKKPTPEAKQVTIASEKQSALLVEGPTVLPAPLWQPEGGTVRCKVVIGQDGKISELESGTQLCEAVPWAKFRYQPPVERGQPVTVSTEVEVKFEPRKQSS